MVDISYFENLCSVSIIQVRRESNIVHATCRFVLPLLDDEIFKKLDAVLFLNSEKAT